MSDGISSSLLTEWDREELRYSCVWEDYKCLENALEGRPPGNVLSIGSAGDNALSLLALGPKKVVALDLSIAQVSLIDLKLKTIDKTDLERLLYLIGYEDLQGYHPTELYAEVRPHLSLESQNYWDTHRSTISDGIVHQGRLEKYFKKFRQQVFPQIWSTPHFANMVEATTLEDQYKFWNSGRLDVLANAVGQFFSKSALSSEGRHSTQFKYVTEDNVGKKFFARFQRIITTQLISENPYTYFFFTGRPLKSENSLPLYNPSQFPKVREQINKVEIKCQDLQSYLRDTTTKFDFLNLSDIFEYMDEVETQSLFRQLHNSMNPGATLCYWTLLVERKPEVPGLTLNKTLSEKLSRNDRTWFYADFNVVRRG